MRLLFNTLFCTSLILLTTNTFAQAKQDPTQPDFLPIQSTTYAAETGGTYFHEAAYSRYIFVESGADVYLEGCWRYID